MVACRVLMHVLAILQMLFTAFTAMVGAFADEGSPGERLLLVVVQPLAAVGLLVFMFSPRLSVAMVRIIVLALVVNVIADIVLAALIALGSVKGDWELPLVFAVIPALGIVYALKQTGLRARPDSRQ